MKWRAYAAELVWEGAEPPASVIEDVRADFAVSLCDLRRADNLIFHTVFLVDDYEDGPSVTVWSVEGDDRLYCEYHETTHLVPLSEGLR